MALIFISKLRRNVLMATILSALVTINRYAPSAMLAGDFVVCLAVDLIKVTIPPLIPASTTAEPLLFPS